MFVSFILIFVLIGFLLIFGLSIFALIMGIVATIKANDGEIFKYPLEIEFIK